MNWVMRSIRNKLLLISGTGTGLLLAASLFGLWLSWSNIQTLEQDVTAYKNSVQQTASDANSKLGKISEATSNTRNGILLSMGLMAVAVATAFFAFLWLVRKNIVNPATQLAHDLDQLAQGNFSAAISRTTEDEIGAIAASAEKLRQDLGTIIVRIDEITEVGYRTAERLADTAGQVVAGSEEQSEAASATAASVEEMAVSIASVAENADNVNQMAKEGLDHTVKGNESLSELIGEISSVESSVEEIASSVAEFVRSTELITNMTRQVKDIAEQTNLLALNAAIEAARAGEQGRGFAVVADEVRKLAEKSAQSASQIDQVTVTLSSQSASVEQAIQNGQKSLQTSQDFLENVAVVLSQANDAVTHATEGINTIALSVNEQKVASDDIAQHVEKISQMAEGNMSAIHENTEASRQMDQLAREMRELIKHFRV